MTHTATIHLCDPCFKAARERLSRHGECPTEDQIVRDGAFSDVGMVDHECTGEIDEHTSCDCLGDDIEAHVGGGE